MDCLPAEDKTCRLCGYADQSNLNMYTMKDVYKKVLALYPIILYQSDPLPKNICLKCYGSALTKYDEYQKIDRIQHKWIKNVRKNQPSNPYIRMLDLIEAANQKITRELENLSSDFYSESFQFIKFNQDFPINIITPPQQYSAQIPSVSSNENNHENIPFSSIIIQQPQLVYVSNLIQTEDSNNISNINTKEISLLPNKPFDSILKNHLQQQNHQYSLQSHQNEQKSGHIERLQSILASNGCTLMTVKDKNALSNYPKNQCRHCLKIFHNQKMLSVHQANKHLKIPIYKIFEKKPLLKKLRRAIEIMVHNKNWFRCQNCWNIYGNHESILNHWKMKRCGFFCKICGIEYPTDPKHLRQHILEKHGLTFNIYKNCKRKITELKSLNNDNNKKLQNINENDDDAEIKINEIATITNDIGIKSELNNQPERIPILKLTRKSNSNKVEFDIQTAIPNDKHFQVINNDDSKRIPMLRVKDISELQDNSNNSYHEENFSSLSNLKLNTINFDTTNKNQKRNSDEL